MPTTTTGPPMDPTASASRSARPPPDCATTSRPGGHHGPTSPSSTTTRRPARAREHDVQGVPQGRGRDGGRLGVGTGRAQPRLDPAGNRRLGDDRDGHGGRVCRGCSWPQHGRVPPAPSRARWRPPSRSTLQHESPASAAMSATSSAPPPRPSRTRDRRRGWCSAAGPSRPPWANPAVPPRPPPRPTEPGGRPAGGAAAPDRHRCRCCRPAAARCSSGPPPGAGRTRTGPARWHRPRTRRQGRTARRRCPGPGRPASPARRRSGRARTPRPGRGTASSRTSSSAGVAGWCQASTARARCSPVEARSMTITGRPRWWCRRTAATPPVTATASATSATTTRRFRPYGRGRRLGLSARAPKRRTTGHVTATTTATTTRPVRTGDRHAAGTTRARAHPTASTNGNRTRSWTRAAPTTQVAQEPGWVRSASRSTPAATHPMTIQPAPTTTQASGPGRGVWCARAGGDEVPPVPLMRPPGR